MCAGTLSLFQIKICDFPYPISQLNCCPWQSSMCPGNLIPISDQNMWFSLPYIRTELLSSKVQHVLWKPYPYFRSKYVIFPTLYQNWTAVLEGPACVLKTLSQFQIKICDFLYPISQLNCCPRESSMCPDNLIPISDQNMWFSLPYITTELLSSRVEHVSWEPYSYFRSKYVIFSTLYHSWTAVLESLACVLKTLSLFQIKICDFPYPISQLNCCPRGSSMCPGNLIPISDQNNVIFSTLYQNWTAILEGPACVLGTLFLFLNQIKVCDSLYSLPHIRTELLGSHYSYKLA